MTDLIAPASTSELPTLTSVKEDVNKLLDIFYITSTKRAKQLHPAYGRLWQTMTANHRGGGKRLRPYIMLLTYYGLGGTQYQTVLPVAGALELLHTALLVHDDIIDRDYMRHGQPNIAHHYQDIYKTARRDDAETTHYANGAALLAGDLLIAGAHQLINTSALKPEDKMACLSLLSDALFVVGGGELLDTEAAFLADGAEALHIAQLKTAHYSFVTPFTTGAVLAGAPAAVQHKLTAVGEAIGVAYQMADDLLGMFGDESVTGKSAVGDLIEGKHTHLIELGLSMADTAGQKVLHRTLGNSAATAADIQAAKDTLTQCGAKAATEQIMLDNYRRALELLENVGLNTAALADFNQLFARLVWREA